MINTKKPRRIFFEVLGGIGCIFIGICGKTVQDKSFQTTKAVTGIAKSAIVASEKIAIVNLDTGIEKDGKTIYYASKIIHYPNSSYETTSLEEAKSGVSKGRYAAYIIIPSSFSESVCSINSTPKQAVFDYKINSYLNVKEREKMIYEIMNFENEINTNISYIYVDAILKEVHNLQDSAGSIMKHDKEDLNAIQSVSVDSLIHPVTFSELKMKKDPIKEVDLSSTEKKMQKSVSDVEKNYNLALANGKDSYKKLILKKDVVKQSLEKFKTQVDAYNPFVDTKGASYVTAGVESLKNEVQGCNVDIISKRKELNDNIIEEINQYAGSNQIKLNTQQKEIQTGIQTTVVSELQKSVDTYMSETNQKVGQYLQEQNTSITTGISEYTGNLQLYLNNSINSLSFKNVIADIASANAQKALQEANEMRTGYYENMAARKAAEAYNSKIEELNETISDMQDRMQAMEQIIAMLYQNSMKPEEPGVSEAPSEASKAPGVSEAPSEEPGVSEVPSATPIESQVPIVTEHSALILKRQGKNVMLEAQTPIILNEISVTNEPEPSALPSSKVTDKPEPSEKPVNTEKPEVSSSPKPTEEPEVSSSPKPSEGPEVSSSPKPTEEIEVSESPEPTEEPKSQQELIEEAVTEFSELKTVFSSLSKFEKETVPEELEEPNVSVSVDGNSIQTDAISSFVNLSQALDGTGSAVLPPNIHLQYEPLKFQLSSNSITYKVPEFKLNNVTQVNTDKLSKIEGLYMLSPDRFTSVIQGGLVNQITERNKVLQGEIATGMQAFVKEQNTYQKSLDQFDPFSFVDKEQIKTDLEAIGTELSNATLNVNQTSDEYRSYVTDVVSLANENISNLQGDMTKASEKTEKNVSNMLNQIQGKRLKNSDTNVSLLKGFTGKLGFTRVGDLPHREAYQFIINPIRYETR